MVVVRSHSALPVYPRRPAGCLCEVGDYARSGTAAATVALVVVVRDVGNVA